MSFLPIEPYLIELIERMDAEDVSLIIAGGLGIYLKHRWVQDQVQAGDRVNLFDTLPDARATDDIDAFLVARVFLQPNRANFRAALSDLGYEPRTDYLLFEKPLADGSGRKVSLDLLSSVPEDSQLKIDKLVKPGKLRRLGPHDNKTSPPEEKLHAFATPEAFAINEEPQSLPLNGHTPSGTEFSGYVRVPHPFASLCMKIKAASDFERAPIAKRKPRAAKHAQDVYLLMAMLSEQELDECVAQRQRFSNHPELRPICEAVTKIFAAPERSGCKTITTNNRDADLVRFSDVISELFAESPGV
jgi:hypothetical protein